MKLNEFRLETYDERTALQMALALLHRRECPDGFFAKAVLDLQERIAHTECQPGGCEYCTEHYNRPTTTGE